MVAMIGRYVVDVDCVVAAGEGRVMFDVGRGREGKCATHMINENPDAMSHVEVYSC